MSYENTGREALELVRLLSRTHGCRIEICSDLGDMPVSASNNARTAYGFGKTVEEAVQQLATNPRKVP